MINRLRVLRGRSLNQKYLKKAVEDFPFTSFDLYKTKNDQYVFSQTIKSPIQHEVTMLRKKSGTIVLEQFDCATHKLKSLEITPEGKIKDNVIRTTKMPEKWDATAEQKLKFINYALKTLTSTKHKVEEFNQLDNGGVAEYYGHFNTAMQTICSPLEKAQKRLDPQYQQDYSL